MRATRNKLYGTSPHSGLTPTLKVDRGKFERDVANTFARVSQSTQLASQRVAKALRREVGATVDASRATTVRGRPRPSNPLRRSNSRPGLEVAITESISVLSPTISKGSTSGNFAGRSGSHGVGVGNYEVLDRLAVYWRAIEYGSDHIVGKNVTLFGIGGPGGPWNFVSDPSKPSQARSKRDPDALVNAKGKGAVVKRGIGRHAILDYLGERMVDLFNKEIDTAIKNNIVTGGLKGLPGFGP